MSQNIVQKQEQHSEPEMARVRGDTNATMVFMQDAIQTGGELSTTHRPKSQSPSLLKLEKADYHRSLAEFIGTLFFIFFSLSAVQAALTLSKDTLPTTQNPSTILMIATSFGLSLAACIAMVGNVSGAHLNPAITIGLASSGLVSIPKALLYIIAQCVGAISGAALVDAVTPGPLVGFNAVSPWIYPGNALLSEVLLTFVVVLTVFKTVVDSRMDPGFIPLLIGFAVFACHLSGITIDGTSVNPARSFGPAVVSGVWDHHWVFWVGPIMGGLLASAVYNIFRKAEDRLDKRD